MSDNPPYELEMEPPTPFPILDPSWLESAEAERQDTAQKLLPSTQVILPSEFILFIANQEEVDAHELHKNVITLVNMVAMDSIDFSGHTFLVDLPKYEKLALIQLFAQWIYSGDL